MPLFAIIARVVALVLVCALSPAPAGDAFFQPPSPLPPGKPGDVVWMRDFNGGSSLRNAARNIQLLYHTHAPDGRDVAVSGTIAIPKGTPPASGWPILSWAHGTTGDAPQCAPSRWTSERGEQRILETFVARGYAVAQTDYEGVGTPGIHPYFVADAAVHDVTDIVRAVRSIDPHIGNRWIAMGHSEGGAAAIFAAARAQAWAPDLHLLGAIAYAPGSGIMGAVTYAMQSTRPLVTLPLSMMMLQGMAAGDPRLSLVDILTPQGLALLGRLQTECIDQAMIDPAWTTVVPSSLFRHGADLMALANDLNANDVDNAKLAAPLLLIQGGADALVPAPVTAAVARDLCASSPTLTYSAYPRATHLTIVAASLNEAQSWVDARFAGQPASSNCGRQ